MPCNCKPNIVSPPAQTKCEDCIQAVSLRFLCSEGPAPCGDTLELNLTDYNIHNVNSCDCGEDVVYSLLEYPKDVFSSVTLSVDGLLEVTTSDVYVDMEEYTIRYKVDCPCNLLSGTGNVYVCMKDMCAGVICAENEHCDQCNGDCVDDSIDLDVVDKGVDIDVVTPQLAEIDLDVADRTDCENCGSDGIFIDLDVTN